jgi:cyanophycinase
VTSPSSGWTVLMGGSGSEGMGRPMVRRFVELAGGAADARVAIVPTASEQRAATIEHYENTFEIEDVQHLEVIDIHTRHHADQPETLQALNDATAIMFTGGDQLRLLSILQGTRFVHELRRRSHDGLVVGGSSAGAMALGDPMIVRGEPTQFYEPGAIPHMPGLAIVPGVTVDTHLVARGRLTRLLPVVAARPDALGVGIEEGSGMTVSPDGLATVYGPGVVCIVDGSAAGPAGGVHLCGSRPGGGEERRLTDSAHALSLTGLQLHVLAAGDMFDLRTRRVVHD